MTNTQYRIAKKYLVYRLFTNLWFVGAIWLYFYRIFITDQQVGILDAMAFAVGLIAEVPSGALADKYGRDKLVRVGHLLAGIGFFIQAFGSDFLPFFVGQAVFMIGVSFVSGADDALFFERLNFSRTSKEWRKLLTRGSQVSLIGTLLATVMGGLLYNINPRIPWILTGLSFIIATFIVWPLIDTRERVNQKKLSDEINEYFHDIRIGFAQFRSSRLLAYVPLILTVQGLFYTAGWGLLRLVLLDRFHFDPFLGSIAIASCSLITVGVLFIMHKYAEHMSEKRVLTIVSVSAAASLLLALGNLGPWGFIVVLALYLGEHILYPFMSEILNNHAPESQRATVLSVGSFLRTLPYVALAPIIGFLNTNNKLEYFFISWAALILLALFLYISAKKHDIQIKLK